MAKKLMGRAGKVLSRALWLLAALFSPQPRYAITAFALIVNSVVVVATDAEELTK